MRRMFQSGLSLLFVLVSVGGAYNVLSDNADVERLAQEVACGGNAPRPHDTAADGGAPRPSARGAASPSAPDPQGCRAQKTRMERTPLAQTFDFATPGHPITVRCSRSAILVGDYSCELR